MNNIYKLQDKIYKSTGVKTMYMRFPGGSSNTVSKKYSKGIMTRLTKFVLSKGFKYFDWNISSGDAGGAKNAKAVYKNVTKSLSKKRGNLVLCHDIHQKTLEALPDIIKYAKKEGYTFSKIDDNTPMYGQHVNNQWKMGRFAFPGKVIKNEKSIKSCSIIYNNNMYDRNDANKVKCIKN